MTGEGTTKRQMADLLTICQQFDGRDLIPATFEAWHQLLGDIPYADIADAVKTHYRRPSVPGERGWSGITPQDIMAHHEKLAAMRAVESARQSPPRCWGPGCDVRYVLSEREGSQFAFPDDKHAADCKAMQGVLVFDPRRPSWGVMPVDPGEFDEVEWEAGQKAMGERMARFRALDDAPEYTTGYREIH